MEIDLLSTAIEYLKGVGPKRAEILKKEAGIFTFGDLLHYYPYRHVDKSKVYKISEVPVEEGQYVQFRGQIIRMELLGQQRAKRLVAYFTDGTGTIKLVWFNSLKWVQDMLAERRDFIIFGRTSVFEHQINISHPELIDPQTQNNSAIPLKFQPLYNSTDKMKKSGLDSKGIAKLTLQLLPQIYASIQEQLSDHIINHYHLISYRDALLNIHFPENTEMLQKAELRLKFDELYFTQLKLLKGKQLVRQKSRGYVFGQVGNAFNEFYFKHLPFDLTDAQKRVIKEIRTDMGSGRQMNRLLQGDVGSGKTITALLVMLLAKDNGFQTCLMAPTEILATQHFETISKLLKDMPLRVELLTGSTKTAQRREIHAGLENGAVDILIGTHALIEDDVKFKNLGLAVIDEQHRFGVQQRAKLWKKNLLPPHILVMTATPIPRTLAMTVYGDLDVSVINELPKGRKPIITKHFFEKSRNSVIGFMRKQIALGRQIFIVYPLIKESEKMDMIDLMNGYDAMAREFPLPDYALGIVHGKAKPEEKDYEMQRFLKGETNILLATTVIEVGINVPNATVMIIENAERFGLSQLHQLRGRVGRGGEQSYCILMSKDQLSSDSRTRLEAMCQTNDGFEIANIDLKLRGPGDVQGTQQSGALDFKIADILLDEKLVTLTRETAKTTLSEDPELSSPQNFRIAKKLHQMLKDSPFLGMIS